MPGEVKMKALKSFQNDENEGNIRRGTNFETSEERSRILELKGLAVREKAGAKATARAAANDDGGTVLQTEGAAAGDRAENPSSSRTGKAVASQSSSDRVRQPAARKSGGRAKPASKRSR